MRPRKLVWSEGLFVTQHHFQSLDAYHEAFAKAQVRAVTPFDWGVLTVEIDARALAVGQVRVARLSAVLPDGTPIDVGDGLDDAVPSRSVHEVFGPQLRELDVYVALATDGPERHRAEQAQVPDANTGTGEQPIVWAKKNLRLLFGDERQESVAAVRIARLVRSTSGAIVESETFVPPALSVGASRVLVGGIERLLAAMTARQHELAASRRQRSEAAVEVDASDTAKFWLLTCLNAAIPLFAHLAAHPRLHPERAYLALAQLVGQLSAFSVDADPAAIPPFSYANLESTFPPLFARALELVETVIAERYVEIPLERLDDRTRLARLTPSTVVGHELFLAARAASPAIGEADLRDRLPRLAKIAARTQIESLLNSAVNGVRLALEYHPPGALPIKPGMVFFKVQRSSEFWRDVAVSGTMAIFLPVEPGAVSLSLYAVDEANVR